MGFEALPTLWPRRLGDGRFRNHAVKPSGGWNAKRVATGRGVGERVVVGFEDFSLSQPGTGGGERDTHTRARGRGGREVEGIEKAIYCPGCTRMMSNSGWLGSEGVTGSAGRETKWP